MCSRAGVNCKLTFAFRAAASKAWIYLVITNHKLATAPLPHFLAACRKLGVPDVVRADHGLESILLWFFSVWAMLLWERMSGLFSDRPAYTTSIPRRSPCTTRLRNTG